LFCVQVIQSPHNFENISYHLESTSKIYTSLFSRPFEQKSIHLIMSTHTKKKVMLLPPLEQGSSSDISSFVGLDLALRSIPELSRENANSLSPKALAILVQSMRDFQRVHLGKDAKGFRWPLVRLPDSLFLDRNRGGPLFTALLSAFRYKQTQPWRNFDLANSKRYDDSIQLFRRMERDLHSAGYLHRPIIYLDESVAKSQKDTKTKINYEKIATQFGAKITKNYKEATHIIAVDLEEMDTPEAIIKEEEELLRGDPPDRTYLRTVALSTHPNTNVPMALVHWWFWPTSQDEWIPAADVDGIPEAQEPKRAPNGAWVLSCKLLRDVARFNEWGQEIDYVLENFENVELFQDESLDWSQSQTAEELAKKSLEGVKMDRRGGKGMNPRLLSTGDFNSKGEKFKVTVFDGALRVPSMVQELLTKYESAQNINDITKNMDPAKNLMELVAPSLDENFTKIKVTELRQGYSSYQQYYTLEQNKVFTKGESLQRIRGGGDIEGKEMLTTLSTQKTEPATRDTAMVPATSNNNTDSNNIPIAAASSTSTVANINPTSSNNTVTIPSAENTAAQIAQQIGQNPSSTTVPASNVPLSLDKVAVPSSLPAVSSTVTPAMTVSTKMTTTDDETPPKYPMTSPLTARLFNPTTMPSTKTPAPTPTSISVPTASVNPTLKTSIPPSGTTTKLPIPSSAPYKAPSIPIPRSNIPQPFQTTSSTIIPPSIQPLVSHLPTPYSKASSLATKSLPHPYHPTIISSLEKQTLPEWFDQSASHRTSQNYLQVRKQILALAEKQPHRYLTATAIRKKVAGDAGSLLRLHKCFTAWRWINSSPETLGESMPVHTMVEQDYDVISEETIPNQNHGENTRKRTWTDLERKSLAQSVIANVSKKQKGEEKKDGHDDEQRNIGEEENELEVGIDWEEVAKEMGMGLSGKDCMKEFLTLDLEEPEEEDVNMISRENATKTDVPTEKEWKEEMIREMLEVPSNILEGALQGAMEASNQDLQQSQKATILSSVTIQATQQAQKEEEKVNQLFLELLDQRMKKLENRMNLLDDVEAMLDVEQTALELERRDLYTARCRYWLGGGTGLG